MREVGYLHFRFKNAPTAKIKKYLISEFKSRITIICLLKSNKKIIGYSMLGNAEKFLKCPVKLRKKSFAYSLGIGIDPKYQRQGIGTLLEAHCKKYLIKNKFNGIYSDAGSDNLASIKFQKKMGFVKIAEYRDPKRAKGTKNVLFLKKF
jgi:ribosomal protein S18 acetylase RimI-like enzyme